MKTTAMLVALVILTGSSVVAEPVKASVHWTRADIRDLVIEEAERQGVPAHLALAVARVESNFNPDAVSRAGALGVMQIMPQTAEDELGISRYRLHDPATNVRAGVRFLRHLIETYDGRWDIALSHYNGGSGVKTGYGGYRVLPATRRYVDQVLHYADQYAESRFLKTDYQVAAASGQDDFGVPSAGNLDDFQSGGRFAASQGSDQTMAAAPAVQDKRSEIVRALKALAERNAAREIGRRWLRDVSYDW